MTGRNCSIHAVMTAALVVFATTPAALAEEVTPDDSGDCAEPTVKSGGEDTTIVNVVCTNGQSKETISGAFTGDFGSKYRAQVKLSYNPPPAGMPPHWGVTVEGKFLRPDCAPAEPGSDAK